jgi:hypothetical protein
MCRKKDVDALDKRGHDEVEARLGSLTAASATPP